MHTTKTNPSSKSVSEQSSRTFEKGKDTSQKQENSHENAVNDKNTEGPSHDFSRIPVFADNKIFIQPKLSINTPGDVYEQEADRMAERVMNLSDTSTASNPHISQQNDAIQRKCAHCEEEEEKQGTLMRKGGNEGGFQASPSLVAQLNATKGIGSPLPEGTRSFMQKAFGNDFQGVRVHTDSRAREMSQGIQARAFTHGQDIYFNGGEYAPESGEGKRLLAHELTHTIQQSSNIQRKEASDQAEEETPVSQPARFIVEDDMSPAEGQMTKSEFLERLNQATCETVDQELEGTPYSSDNCPYIRAAFARHQNSSPTQLEQVIARYEPNTASAQSAEDLIELMLRRVRIAVNRWKQRGSLADVPEDVSSLLADSGSAAPPAANTEGGNEGNPTLQFKANPGGAQATDSPQSVMQSLGKGNSLDGSTRGRMESAFGTDFGHVEVHTDSHASNLASGMNARAFAVGNHIAFGSGEHQPGTLVGDALMAHELAHTLQQGDGVSNVNSSAYSSLEEDADFSAMGAVTSLWTGLKGDLKDVGKKMKPRLQSRLQLQRCSTYSKGPIAIKRADEAKKNFRSENSSLGKIKLDKIDAALAIATKDNLNLLISYYDYYSNHDISEVFPTTARNYAETKPSSGTKVRKDLLTPGFSDATLGSVLIHEYVHTRHETNVMGTGDYQEGEAYAVEYVIAERSSNTVRTKEIEQAMNKPSSLAMPALVPSLIANFKIAYATMITLYEIVDKGSSSKAIPALTTPNPLTQDEAKEMITEYIAQKETNRSKRLNEIVTWIKANLTSFSFPI